MGKREPTLRRKTRFFKKKSFNKQRGEKYKRKYYQKPSTRKPGFSEKLPIIQQEKITVNIGHAEK